MYGLALVLLTSLLVSGCGSSDGSGEATAPTPGTTPPVIQPIPPPVSTARTWAVHGHTADGGTFEGTFTYAKDAAPSGVNVRGRENVVYALTAWSFEVRPTYRGIPTPDLPPVLFFKHTGLVDTSELCFNSCLLDPNDFSRLAFDNGLQTLVLAFQLPAPHTALPTEAGDWGVFEPRASYLQSGDLDGTFQYRMVVTDSELVEG